MKNVCLNIGWVGILSHLSPGKKYFKTNYPALSCTKLIVVIVYVVVWTSDIRTRADRWWKSIKRYQETLRVSNIHQLRELRQFTIFSILCNQLFTNVS